MEGKAAAVPPHIKLINISRCLRNENAKSAENPGQLCYYAGRFSLSKCLKEEEISISFASCIFFLVRVVESNQEKPL